ASYYDAYPKLTSRIPALESLAVRAQALGNPELAAVARWRRGDYAVWRSDLAKADELYAKAEALAEAARSPALANLILADRAFTADKRDDSGGARSLIKLA